MSEPLKNYFTTKVPRALAASIAAVYPRFDTRGFMRDVSAGYDELGLIPRGRKIAEELYRYLPQDFPRAVQILSATFGSKLIAAANNGMAPFFYLPHSVFIARYGLEHFEVAMRAQYELTQRFTAEFSIRPFLERYPEATLKRLAEWANDPSEHVRRLVSEGTRPRLPWAPRLRAFQTDPRPVLRLLELLKDDPALYVRRSVANNLNDIGKDHPDILVKTAKRWLMNASEDRSWIVRHALRSAIKRGDPGALGVLGFGSKASVSLEDVMITPRRAQIGEKVRIGLSVRNLKPRTQMVLVDLRIHYVKARGLTAPKVFKLKQLTLEPRASVRLEKSISVADMTTRRHYPGSHGIDVLVNGEAVPIGDLTLLRSRQRR